MNPSASTLSPHPGISKRRLSLFRFALCVLSGVMLGLSFPPSSLGILACFGLVPWLIVLADIERTKRALWFTYVTFVTFHIITLNWTGGYEHGNDCYMMIAGGLTMFLHPLFYFIPTSIFLYIRNSFGEKMALSALPFLWVAYEFSHSLSEWSFPWLTIGNSQSYDLARMQFIPATGIYGLSFWILLINVLAYMLYSNLAQGKWRTFSGSAIMATLLLCGIYLAPKIHGEAVLADAPQYENGGLTEDEKQITVAIVQSNVDPWLKWTQRATKTLELYLGMSRTLVRSSSQRPDLMLWPETAIPYRFLTPGFESLLGYLRTNVDNIGVSVLTGFYHKETYRDSADAPPSAKRVPGSGERYDNFNAVAFIQPGTDDIPWYGKMKMVPFAERVPYADAFYLLDFLRWGVGIGGWQIGRDSTIFIENRTGARFCVMICYESTYPAFVAAFVKKGAEFISIVTIDSWWGHMSGAYQHQQFALFRAVENRRWVARCAVGGISCFIDPFGRVYDRTELFTQTTLSRTIGRSNELTLYSRYGDWLAIICVFVAGMFFAAALGLRFMKKHRRMHGNEADRFEE